MLKQKKKRENTCDVFLSCPNVKIFLMPSLPIRFPTVIQLESSPPLFHLLSYILTHTHCLECLCVIQRAHNGIRSLPRTRHTGKIPRDGWAAKTRIPFYFIKYRREPYFLTIHILYILLFSSLVFLVDPVFLLFLFWIFLALFLIDSKNSNCMELWNDVAFLLFFPLLTFLFLLYECG